MFKITFLFFIFVLCFGILQITQAQNVGSDNLPYTKLLKQAQLRIQNAIKDEIPKNMKVLTTFSLDPELTQTAFLQSTAEKIKNLKYSAITASSSEICFNQSLATVMEIMQGQYWAIKMFDAVDKLPSGILDGNTKLMGSYDACLAITSEIDNTGSDVILPQYNGQYCWTEIPINIFPGYQLKLDMGICMPDTCSNNDTLQILNTLLPNIRIGNVPLYSDGVVCKDDVGDLDTRAILMIVLCSFFGLLILCGTAYDVIIVRWYSKRQKHEEEKVMKNTMDLESNSMEKRPLLNKPVVSDIYTPGIPGQLLLSFSVYTNGAKLLNTTHSAGTLTCINGIRFISMSWVILGHAVAFGLGTGSNLNSFFPKMIGRWTFQAIANALVSVDTFFALSGLLVSYLALKEMKKNNGRLNWGMFYFHRFWRLTPPYMLILGVYVSLNRYWSDGPLWPENGMEKDFCKDTWWKNLLYINNIVDRDNQCFGWAWYLANDMQFYILSPLMFVPLYFFNGWGLISSAVFLIGNGVATYFVSEKYKLPPTTIGGVDEKTSGDYMTDYYFVPWCRIGPYVIGVVAGYCLYKANGRIKIHWVTQ